MAVFWLCVRSGAPGEEGPAAHGDGEMEHLAMVSAEQSIHRVDAPRASRQISAHNKLSPHEVHGPAKGVVLIALAAALLIAKTQYSKPSGAPVTAPLKPGRIDAFDSVRFFFSMYFVFCSFIWYAHPPDLLLKVMSQGNVVAGAFFAMSGYVAAYTTTEIGEKKIKPKIASMSAPKFILQRVFGFWPLHFLVLLLFSPMFIYMDIRYSGPVETAWHGLLAVTMTQVWFPLHAEIWNGPAYILGAFTFTTILQPYLLPIFIVKTKEELRRKAIWLAAIAFFTRVGYCHDLHSWSMMEGTLAAKQFPNLAMFKYMLFMPFFAAIEVMLGFVACRLVMLDGAKDEPPVYKVGLVDTLVPLLGMVGMLLLRALGIVKLGDLIVRSCIFMPLFLLFLMGVHRASVQGPMTDPVAKLLVCKPLVWLGGFSFPIYMVHGPLGDLFYRQTIGRKLWGGTMLEIYGPGFFFVYVLLVVLSGFLLQHCCMASETVRAWSNALQAKLLRCL